MDKTGSDEKGLGMAGNRRGPNMECRDTDSQGFGLGFKGDMRGPNMEGPEYDGSPDFRNPLTGRSSIDMEIPGGRGPGPDFRGPRPENRNPNIECPGVDRRGTDLRGPGSERQGLDMENPEPGRQRREQDFRNERRGPHMRRLGPDEKDSQLQDDWKEPDKRGPFSERQCSDRGHRPERWGPNTEGSGSDRRGPDMMEPGLDRKGPEAGMKEDMQGSFIRGPMYNSREPAMGGMEPGVVNQMMINERRGSELRHADMSASLCFSNPRMLGSETQGGHQATSFQGPSGQQSPLFNRPLAQAPESGGLLCPRLGMPQNQQTVKPQRHRGPLLPTPTEGLIRFPNRMINKVDVFSLKQKQTGHATDCHVREWNRGTPAGVSKGTGEEKTGKETEKIDCDGNKQNNVEPRETKAENNNTGTAPDSKVPN